jgi:hypothetical protein
MSKKNRKPKTVRVWFEGELKDIQCCGYCNTPLNRESSTWFCKGCGATYTEK